VKRIKGNWASSVSSVAYPARSLITVRTNAGRWFSTFRLSKDLLKKEKTLKDSTYQISKFNLFKFY